MDAIVSEDHSCEDNELENTVVYHACAVTLSMKKPLEEEETLLEDGTGSSLIDLWTCTVSRLNLYSSFVFRQDLCPCL
jgi:hypothetical protein